MLITIIICIVFLFAFVYNGLQLYKLLDRPGISNARWIWTTLALIAIAVLTGAIVAMNVTTTIH